MKGISILGSTGSIGCNTLKVIEHLGDLRVVALGAGRNMPRFAEQIARFMQYLREQPFQKVPGVAESLDWALALIRLHRDAIDGRTLEQTVGCILKVREDWELLRAQRTRYEPLLDGAAPSAQPLAPPEPDYGIGTVRAHHG